MSNRFILLFLSACSAAFAQQPAREYARISGAVVDLISNEGIAGAEVQFFQRALSFTKKGEPILGGLEFSTRLPVVLTDAFGRFSVDVPLRQDVDYYNLTVTAPGKEPIFKNIVAVERHRATALETIYLTPEHPSEAEERAIELRTQAEREKKESAKLLDADAGLSASPAFLSPSGGPCTYADVPVEVYVKNLVNGYNGSQNGNGFTGFINFDEYVAGVVQGELGGITSNLDTKKAQAIAARTFSQNRHLLGLPVNIGQAYNDNPNGSSMTAASETSTEVVLFNNTVIDAKYSARCNGNYTQNATQGVWAPYSSCNTYGNFIPYLLSRPCSGHPNCSVFSENPCCNSIISTTNQPGYIYGHGVGMCQRGIEQLGEIYHLDYCTMLKRYYTNVCIANADCDTTNLPLDCSNAVLLTPGVTYSGPSSTANSNVSSYGCNNWTETGPERVHLVTPAINGVLTATLSNFSGDLDVYILGSCDPADCLGAVSSSSATYAGAQANQPYYIVVDADDGSGSAYDLIVTVQPVVSAEEAADNASWRVFPNPTTGLVRFNQAVEHVEVFDAFGGFIGAWEHVQELDLGNLPKGMYMLRRLTDKGQWDQKTILRM